jgi:hypothetical protein
MRSGFVGNSNARFGHEVEREASNLLAKIDAPGASRDARTDGH